VSVSLFLQYDNDLDTVFLLIIESLHVGLCIVFFCVYTAKYYSIVDIHTICMLY
jgi:hypothetical protein